ncbi:MAG TPA: hypothetical protein VGN26_16550 [Armatimonadota bacterium]|jgi:hypothetical protein
MAFLNIAVSILLILLLAAALVAMALDLLGVRDAPRAEALEDWSEEAQPAVTRDQAAGLAASLAADLAPPVAEVIFTRDGEAVHARSLYGSSEITLGAAEDPVLEGDVAFRSLAVRWQQGQPWFRALDSTGPPRYLVSGQERPVAPRQWIPWLSEGVLELGGCALSWRAHRSGATPVAPVYAGDDASSAARAAQRAASSEGSEA